MQGVEARLLLGFPPNSRPTPSQIKAAYRKKVWESHPDLFPVHQKPSAESKFKLIAEAYTCLQSGSGGGGSFSGVPKAHGGRKNRALIQIPFLLIVLGTVGLGGLNATRAYRKQKETCPSHNPFLP
ncbi:dnaJ homolog subfamily B member 6-B isoform X2 [Hibiscus syriacus]|uniref:dnaJ homolog subfamily B member 6-B isoform X2 n=1 Tax=Hibiscus syriacus TaxID=106335 RepID=UPI00192163B5|nr:dnaJ homolog subfamily B member 6-B isoform X2 [Hibiscus syriacus]